MSIKDFGIRLFISIFFISSIFSYWTSWNEESTLLFSKEIVENKDFYLDKYINKTGDWLLLENHYILHPRKFFFSLLYSPIYLFLSFFWKDIELIKSLSTYLVSCLFFSLSCILLYKITKKIFKNEKISILCSVIYSLCTLTFQQARFFTSHTLEAFLLLLSFCLLIESSFSKKMKYVFLSAIILSFCILLNLIAGVYFVLVIFYFFLKKEFQKIFILFLTPFVSFFFFSLYSYTYLSSFFSIFTFLLSPPEILTQFFNYSVKTFPISYLQPYLPTGFISRTFPLPVFFQALIFPSKGIFFYYPVLLFSFIGFFLAKKYKLEFLLLFFSIFFAFLFYSIYAVEWWYGWVSYGPPRVLTMLMPFFVMGLANFLDRFDFKFLIPFFIVSLVNNFLLLQYGEDKISMLPWEEYKSKMENFQVLSNPLFEHYLPLTLINGPRSILLENLIIDKKISIDLKHPYNPITPEFIPPGSPIMKKFEVYLFSLPKVGIVVLRLPWLSLFVTMAVIFFIWRREISSLLKIKPKFLMLLLIFLFFVFFIRIRDFVLGNNWCAPQWDLKKEKMMENGRWTGGNATLFLFSKNEIDRTLKFTVESFRKNQTFKIYLNGEIIGDYIVENKKEILKSIHLKKGVNEIFLDTNDFIEPWKIGVNCDIDVSLKIEELKIF